MAKGRIGRFRFRIETNHNKTKWFVWYKEGIFGSKTYVYFYNDKFDEYTREMSIENEFEAWNCLAWAKQRARDIIYMRDCIKKSSIRLTFYKEP